MLKLHLNKARDFFPLLIVGLCAAALVAAFMPVTSNQVSADPQPAKTYDASSATFTVPSLKKGVLSLQTVAKSGVNAGQVLNAKELTANVIDIADINRATGQFLFQTASDGTVQEDVTAVTTWLGDRNGHVQRLLQGAGYVKLSPGGHYVAFDDAAGILKIADLSGHLVADYGPANTAVFSSDGSKVAFFRSTLFDIGSGKGIAIYDLPTGKALKVYDPDNNEYFPLTFSSDGNTLYFTAHRFKLTESADPANQNRVDIYELSIASSTPRLVTTGTQKLPYSDFSYSQVLTPSNRLVLGADQTVWLIDLGSGRISVFSNSANPVQLDDHGGLLIHDPSNSNPTWRVVDFGAMQH